ncbi:hypothetical protein R50073_34690 [Maricurvus nonylphenolicus]
MAAGFSLSATVSAQGTPAEFAELSLQDLLHIPLYESGVAAERWTFSYHYSRLTLDGYQDGDSKIAKSELLWRPGQTRSQDNYPVLPTEITQQVHLLAAAYQSDGWGLTLSLPYIKQSTDHISSIPGYDKFTIHSEGLGDVSVVGSYSLSQTLLSNWTLTAGLSFPTGSIDEKGDTPRAPGNQQLPYTMQLGSGTYDLPLSLRYQSWGQHQWSLALSAKLRTGKNDRGYRLGNYWRLSGQYDIQGFDWGQPYIGAAYEDRQAIHGQDDDLTVAGAYPYPASITNPDLFGGRQLDLKVGMRWSVAGHRFTSELGAPLYQHLNGPQPREQWQLRLKYELGI